MRKPFELRWEGELAGSPQQIWDAITRHGAAWVWDIDYEPRVGGAERGLTSKGGTVTAWEPEKHFRTEARRDDGWHNALDYTFDGSHVNFLHTTVFTPGEYAVQADACIQHTRFYYHSLGEYLRHFAGATPHYLGLDAVPGSTADILSRLGIPATATPGDRIALGTIDYRDGTMVGIRTETELLRVYGRDVWGWPVGFAVHSFDGAPDTAAWREKVAA